MNTANSHDPVDVDAGVGDWRFLERALHITESTSTRRLELLCPASNPQKEQDSKRMIVVEQVFWS